MRVVIVGTGIAGLIAAHRASARHEVVLVTKAELAESSTRYAQGGIAAALFPDDSPAAHVADTLAAGAGLCDPHAVEVLCTEGPARVRDLIALGVAFDTDASGALARGHEAAHSARRVLHAGGDATGLAIEVALLRAVKAIAVEVHEHAFLRDLVVEPGPDGPRVTGVDLLGPDGTALRIAADAVVLATGGAGQLYAHTTNPAVTTGDGIAAAWRAGAVLSDLEFFQFHPTALAVPGNHLISEAVRGDGAVLRDEAGRRFMLDVHPDAELAPRDVVARGIARAMAGQGGRPVLLDATSLGAEYLARRFPGIDAVVRAAGFDWGTVPVPVTPAAHYWMGGIRTDEDGRTSVEGLYAIGEAARTGVHGANRLASNSLLESLVFAWRAADALDAPWREPGIADASVPEESAAASGAPPFTRTALRELMWERAGLERDAEGLRAAAATLAAWSAETPVPGGASGPTDASGPADAREPTDASGHEDANLLALARLLVGAALRREESRGAHYRSDFPDTSADAAHSQSWRIR